MTRVDLESTLANARARLEQAPRRPLAPYARLTRKEARVREDQYAALSALARELMRKRPRRVERITENTLIRIAIDLLLAHADRLRGATETELRDSVTPRVRLSGTSEVRSKGTVDLSDSQIHEASGSRGSQAGGIDTAPNGGAS